MKLLPEEPEFGPWKVVSLTRLLDSWRPRFPGPGARPGVLAVDGRSASGKSTLAAALSRAVPGSVVVHTDDLAWHQSFFDWAGLLVDGVLVPVHAAQEVRYRPPAWEERSREGAIAVPSGCPLVIVEGCGAARRELTPWTDVAVWVQSDTAKAKTRGLVRDGGSAEAEAFWTEWMAEELPFFAQDRPWERADMVVSGMPELDHDPASQLVVSAKR
jgi:energy-coupling factor transporter ATP-binding protein EcfA2